MNSGNNLLFSIFAATVNKRRSSESRFKTSARFEQPISHARYCGDRLD